MRYTFSIKNNRDFRALYRSKKSYVCPYFVLYCRKNRLGFNRLGLTAGTKLGGAVQRNRARRRLRELYRLYEPSLRPSYDLVIVARTRSLHTDFALLRHAFEAGVRSLGLVRPLPSGEEQRPLP